ncbi:MAG: hypothetical protein H8D67_15635, partial [Deltaproteobacteria bacterium]|nr:hypothetical protein [Deltaproteobacteria bacterium]
KTIEALAVIKHLDAFPAIVVCPAAVKINWAREAKKWLPGKTVEVWYGRNGNGNNRKADIIIINYDIISDPKKRDKQVLRDDLKAVNSKTVILDESHYIKSHKSRRTRAAKELGKGAMIKLCLTGTPVLNRPNELISPLTFLERLEEIGGFWHFVNRYCLPPNAPILMADLTEKVISEIQIGDKVIGWDRRKPRYYHGRKDLSNRRLCESEVLQILVRKAPLQKIILEDNTELVCTPDHRWLNGRSEQREPDKEYSVARTGRLGGRERGCASRIVQILEAPQPQFGETTEYKQGYLIGLFRGDGWCTRTWSEKDIPFRNNKSRYIKGHSVGVTTKDRECIDRSENYIQDLAPNLIYRRHQRKDKLHSLGMNHAEGFKFITSILPIDLDAWWAGFLGGIYDAEGSGLVIGQYRKYNPQTWKMIIHALERFGFEYRIGKQERTIRVRGGRSSMLKLWKIANPTLRRKLVAYCLNTAGRFSSGNLSTMRGAPFVTAIKQLPGIHKVYTLTTTTGNYVAYGCGSKNCDAHHNGWGWDFSGASNLDELHSKLKETCFIRRRKEDVLLELPTKRRAVVPIPIDNNDEYQYAERNLVEWVGQAAIEKEEFLAEIADLNEEEQKPAKRVRASEARWKARNAEQLVRIEALKQLAVKGKMASLKKWVKDFLETGEKLVVFAHHRAVVKELAKEFKAPTIMGGDNLKTRQEVIDEFQTGSCQLIVCSTKAVGVGITLTAASNVAFVELGWTPAEMLQAEDRLHRIGQPNAVNVHLLLAAGTVEEEIARLLDKKRSVIDATTDGTEMGEDEGILKALIKALQKE